jgi:hypothetical protein
MGRRNRKGSSMTRHFDFPRPHLHLPAPLRRGRDVELAHGSLQVGVVGAVALGALAIGAIAIGALAINRLVVKRARVERLSVGTLEVGRLVIHDREDPDDEVFDDPEAAAEAA